MGKSLEQIQQEAGASLRRSQERRSHPDSRLLPKDMAGKLVVFFVAALLAVALIVGIYVMVAAFGGPQT